MSYSGRKHEDFDYRTKLLGILPCDLDNMKDGPWDTKNLKVCKKPSQYIQGQLDLAGHPTLVGSAIVERRFGLESEFPSASTEDEDTGSPTSKPTAGSIEASTDACSSESEESSEQEDEDTDTGATRFVRNCFNPTKTSIPDFICDRLALIFLATEEASYVLKARKCRFTSPADSEKNDYEAIELKFFNLPFGHALFGGPQFVHWATKDDGQISTSMKSMTVAETSTKEHSEPSLEKPEENGDEDSTSDPDPYHYAFVQGELTKNSSQSPRRKFNFILRCLVGGVWSLEENPEDYTCRHLAEMRTANETVVQPRQNLQSTNSSFYKRVRMQRNWFQAHLAGEKNYLVGINDVNADRNRYVKELWLFDVDKIPRAVSIAAEDEGFIPWTPDKLHHKVFNALEFINEIMKDAKPDEEVTFIHCDDSDYIYCDRDGSLLNEFIASKNKLTIRKLPRPPSVLDEAEQEEFDKSLMITILKRVGYFRGVPLPLIRRTQGDFELTFIDSKLAEAFFALVKMYWCRNVKIPAGFEKLWIERSKLNEPLDFKGPSKSLSLIRHNRFPYDRSGHSHSGGSYGGRSSFDGQNAQHSSPFGRQTHYTNRTRTVSDTVENWRK